MAVLFPTVVANQNLPAATLNAGWDLTENTFLDLGPLVITGLTLAIGAGLSVDVAAGTAVIGGRVTKTATFTIAGLTPSTTNHLYLLQNGTGTSNTTGTQPANSVKLGLAVTGVATVTSVDGATRASGRQAKIRTENLEHGAGAGHPAAVDLADWHATNNEPNQVKGVLPAGAIPAGFTAPVTLTLDDANQNSVQTVLTLRHTFNAGAGADGIGARTVYEVETETAGVSEMVARIAGRATDATAATIDGALDLQVAANSVAVTVLSLESGKALLTETPLATANHGVLNVGPNSWSGGGGGAFAGDPDGQLMAVNGPSGFNGVLLYVQSNGSNRFFVSPSGNIVSVNGIASDVRLRMDLSTSQSANAMEIRDVAGTNIMTVGPTGLAQTRIEDTTNNAVSYAWQAAHGSSAAAGAAGIGVGLELRIETATEGVLNTIGTIEAVATTATAAATVGRIDLRVTDAGTLVTPLSIATKKVVIEQAALASANHGLLNVGTGFTGGADHFAGSPSGTQVAINAPSGSGGSLLDVQIAGRSVLTVLPTQTRAFISDAFTAAVTTPLQIGHVISSGVGAVGIGTRLQMMAESSTESFLNTLVNLDAVTITSAAFGAASSQLHITVLSAGVQVTPYQIAATTTTLSEGHNLVLGTTTGTKIGTATTQKLGFWNATPVVRGAAWTPTNVTTDRSWDCNATTLDEIADALATLVVELQGMGLLS